MVLDNFIHRSVTNGLGSPMVEIMADTAVALASANVQLVAKKVIGRLCRVRWCGIPYRVPPSCVSQLYLCILENLAYMGG